MFKSVILKHWVIDQLRRFWLVQTNNKRIKETKSWKKIKHAIKLEQKHKQKKLQHPIYYKKWPSSIDPN